MTKKLDDLLLFWAIVIVITISPFVYIYNLLGGFRLAAILIGIPSICFIILIRYKRKRCVSLQDVALKAITTGFTTKESKDINYYLMRTNNGWAQLVRKLQIIKDSIDISLTSKKRNTAESRMELLKKHWSEIKGEYLHLLDDDVKSKICSIVDEATFRYHTVFYINQANGYLDKCATLKTEKSRAKYRELAHDVILEGLGHPESDRDELRGFLATIT